MTTPATTLLLATCAPGFTPEKFTRTSGAWLVLALLLVTPLAHSQTLCNSDGQAAPTALLERFVNADCDTCWQDLATPVAQPGTLALDWIVPSDRGDDAALSNAASLDALQRLDMLKRHRPSAQDKLETKVMGWPGASLQVARGPAFGPYVGASIELFLPAGTQLDAFMNAPLTAWLVLVEALPAGSEASPVPRNLVRNVLQLTWSKRDVLSKTEQTSFDELRPLNIPAGVPAERLRVIGWVQDASGRVLVAAESVCPVVDKGD